MSDLKGRFGSLDRIPVPDLWRDISHREPAEVKLGPSWRRVAVAALALLVAAAGIGVATWAFIGDRDPRRVVRPLPITAKSNGKIAFFRGPGSPFSGQNLFLMDANGTHVHQLTRGGSFFHDAAWSPDGQRVAMVEGSPVEGVAAHIVVANADGGGMRQVTVGSVVDGHPRWSPDGKFILFDRSAFVDGRPSTDYDLYLMRSDGTQVHPVFQRPGWQLLADWSPDGTRIVFVGDVRQENGSLDLMLINPDGTGLRGLTRTQAIEWSPRWSPDGSKIVFIRQESGSPDSIWLVSRDGVEEQMVYSCEGRCGRVADVAWSPDGKRIAFTLASRDRASRDIYVMDADGSNVDRMTKFSDACCPAWQPIGVFAPTPTEPTPIPGGHLSPTPQSDFLGDIAYQTSFGTDAHIWVMHPDGSGAHMIANGNDPAWSPDGSQIAFRANFAKSRTDIMVMNADGSDQRSLAKGFKVVPFLWFGGAPSWSPDGTMIVFAAEEGLYVVDTRGGEPQFLADSPDCLEYDPAWSPDGTQVAFGVGCSEETSDAQAGLAVINADGTGWHRIIGPGPFAHTFPPSNPVWSPDGLHIAFDSVAGEGSFGSVYVANADGSSLFEFIDGIEPAWSADGSMIAFCLEDVADVRASRADIYVVGVDGKGRQRLTSTKSDECNPAWQPIFGTP